jgi:hypothetical protein
MCPEGVKLPIIYTERMASTACARCGRALAPAQIRRVPGPVAAAVEIAMAFFHGGLWAQESMKRPFCARCVRLVVAACVALSAAVLSAAAFGVALWLHGPGR